ncbi:MAG TPA: DUF883 family protein [Steroidobacteraceae bacterium]
MDKFKAMSDLVADAEELLVKLGNSASPEVKALRDKVEQSIDDMKSQVRSKVRIGADAAQELGANIVEYAQENPWVAAAAATTVAVAFIFLAMHQRERRWR